MARPQGNPFILLAVVLSSWVAGRAILYERVTSTNQKTAAILAKAPMQSAAVSDSANDDAILDVPRIRTAVVTLSLKSTQSSGILKDAIPSIWAMKDALVLPPHPFNLANPTRKSAVEKPAAPIAFMPLPNAALSFVGIATPPMSASTKRALSLYAYSYWRAGQADATTAFGGQYGASQSALIATVPLGGRLRAVSLLGRLTFVPSASNQSELALGVRWQPIPALPVTLSAERRMQRDGQGRFSVYVVGSKDNITLPAHFTLSGYGQLGLASRGLASGPREIFYDAQFKIDRALVETHDVKSNVGVGAWAGGQANVSRVDIGPTVRATFPLGKVQLRIDADWRFRVKGVAKPNSGPALTLSTSF
jgi:hypothetical protein